MDSPKLYIYKDMVDATFHSECQVYISILAAMSEELATQRKQKMDYP